MAQTILLVDDEAGIVTIMKQYFEAAGFLVLTAYNGAEALKKVKNDVDIILLDINMPDIDGLRVCERIRELVTCPILFLTARIETEDKIKGFQAGGDDYIVKPFDLDELGARVAAHLRRENRHTVPSAFRIFDDLVIDYTKREVTIAKQPVNLSKKEFDIVELLSMHAGQVFDRERIYEEIWGMEGDGNSATIMEHIRKIRSKFSLITDREWIETVWGVGYKWIS